MIRLPRTWKGIDRAAWPALNKIADLLEKMANSQTDGSIVWNLDEGTMYVPEPQEFEAVILGGTNPYAWAKLRSDVDGVWYAMNEEEGSEIGWPEDFAVATIKAASWAGGTVTFTLDQDISVAAGEELFVAGAQPEEYNGTYTAVTGSGTTFTATLASDPGTYITGGAACKASSGNDAFREGYEYNSNETVPKGKVVWLKPRYLTDGDGTDQEYKFPYCCEPVTSNTTLIETTVSRSHNSTQNNYPTNNYTAYLLNPTVNFSITGFANGVCGKVIEILNSSTDPTKYVTVISDSGGAHSENRYAGYGGANDVIPAKTANTYFYDCTQNKWIKKASPGLDLGCRMADGAVFVSAGATTKIGSFNTSYDTDSMVTGGNKITINTPGKYYIWARARSDIGLSAPSANSFQQLRLYKNGVVTDFIAGDISVYQSGSAESHYALLQLFEEELCAVGDFFELYWVNGDANPATVAKAFFGARKVDRAG